ncbi:hypothetical protein ACFL2Q_10000 [Thermodesulfobacteriota bacterium]
MGFVEPYVESAATIEDFEDLLSIVLLAWNSTMLPPEEREELLARMQADIPRGSLELLPIIEDLIGRKDQYFAQYRGKIIDCLLTETPEGMDLSVISVVEH